MVELQSCVGQTWYNDIVTTRGDSVFVCTISHSWQMYFWKDKNHRLYMTLSCYLCLFMCLSFCVSCLFLYLAQTKKFSTNNLFPGPYQSVIYVLHSNLDTLLLWVNSAFALSVVGQLMLFLCINATHATPHGQEHWMFHVVSSPGQLNNKHKVEPLFK